MALLFRLGGRAPQLALNPIRFGSRVLRSTSVTANESYDERNTRLQRPVSPHLSVYKFQLTSVLSISHRAAGLAIAVVPIGLGLGSIFLPQPISLYIEAINALNLSSPVVLTAKFLLAFPFSYHFCNGVRHLLWDAGKGLNLKQVYASGYAMLGASFVLSVILLSL